MHLSCLSWNVSSDFCLRAAGLQSLPSATMVVVSINHPSGYITNPGCRSWGGSCQCSFHGAHFVIEGPFTKVSIKVFKSRCRPDACSVYGREPKPGEAVSAFSAAYPLALCSAMAKGAWLFKQDLEGLSVDGAQGSPLRPWHQDPDWVKELALTLPFRELFRYSFKKSGHINCLECRVFKSWVKHCSKACPGSRIVGFLDSRVTIGASAKGRAAAQP